MKKISFCFAVWSTTRNSFNQQSFSTNHLDRILFANIPWLLMANNIKNNKLYLHNIFLLFFSLLTASSTFPFWFLKEYSKRNNNNNNNNEQNLIILYLPTKNGINKQKKKNQRAKMLEGSFAMQTQLHRMEFQFYPIASLYEIFAQALG